MATLVIAYFSAASLASAHERDTFKIGSKYYILTVGSLNEPFVVDNISGVDLRVSQVAGPAGNGSSKETGKGTPVTGLEQTLKVELAAGDKKETLSFDPSDEAPGSYAANFIPTVQTTYSYRIFGTINGSPVDLTFTCVAGEVSETAEDNSQLKVSDTITRINKIGAFALPGSKKEHGLSGTVAFFVRTESEYAGSGGSRADGRQTGKNGAGLEHRWNRSRTFGTCFCGNGLEKKVGRPYMKCMISVIMAVAFAGAAFANGLGGERLEKVVGDVIVDIGTDQSATPVAGQPIEFDFNLLKSDTREPLTTPTSIGIDIGRNGKSIVNCDLITEMPNTFLFYTFPEGGDYTLKVTFFDSKRAQQALATASFPITISGSGSKMRAVYIAALFACIILGLVGGYWGARRRAVG